MFDVQVTVDVPEDSVDLVASQVVTETPEPLSPAAEAAQQKLVRELASSYRRQFRAKFPDVDYRDRILRYNGASLEMSLTNVSSRDMDGLAARLMEVVRELLGDENIIKIQGWRKTAAHREPKLMRF